MTIDLCIHYNPAEPINERKEGMHAGSLNEESLLSIDEQAPSGNPVVGRTQSLGFRMMISVLGTPEAFSLSMKKGTYMNKYYSPVRNFPVWTLSCLFSPEGYPYCFAYDLCLSHLN